ncbi:hypothetical protein [Desertibacillus haloalkaliphilus]|uniref:hypothetical protein n=1 Tax=Desertibacillus haloalkaliphilus TaxID=1328930 RepID=UPI001C25F7DC|nr:hypothetical protein [Desertibacillus haloalkaliphilus]MBU8906892.1 hypothetical protein [Desertibacillus haloalkaliphilus]
MSHSHKKHRVCIKVPKVYDWVNRQVELPLISFHNEELEDIFEVNNKHCFRTSPAETLCEFLDAFPGYQVECNLRPDSILCQEITQPNGRQDIPVTLPTGETITLQKVKVLVKGLVDVNILDAQGNVIARTAEPIPFATAQTFFMCAPEGTELQCHVTYFQCDADVICTDDFQQLDISIILCLEPQMETEVKLEIDAAICKPREELPIEDIVCPPEKFPPQCPEIFPGDKH